MQNMNLCVKYSLIYQKVYKGKIFNIIYLSLIDGLFIAAILKLCSA